MASAFDFIAAIIRSSQHTIRGRLTRDPEMRYFDSGSCKLSMNMAVNKPGAKRDDGSTPDWFKVELWGDDATDAADKLFKGDLVEFTGRVVTSSWETREGEVRTDLVIKAEAWKMIRRPQPDGGAPRPQAPAPAPGSFGASADPMEGWDDDEIPF